MAVALRRALQQQCMFIPLAPADKISAWASGFFLKVRSLLSVCVWGNAGGKVRSTEAQTNKRE
jgi:hypothetical protein